MTSDSLRLESIYDVAGRLALVTGGGTGIGWMIAHGLASNGAIVYITGRRKEVLEKAASSFESDSGNGKIIPLVMDCTDRGSISAAQKKVKEEVGKLHILVNNAGQIGPASPFFNDLHAPQHMSPETLGQAVFDDQTFADWAQLYSVNTASVFFVTMAFLGLLAKGSDDRAGYTSCVINVSSISGMWKFAYCSSKAGLQHLTRMLATEFALMKIPVRVCGVAPGVHSSELTPGLGETVTVDDILTGVVPTPTNRPGSAQEMAGTVLYLVSPAGCYTNGQEIVVDGGASTVNPSTA